MPTSRGPYHGSTIAAVMRRASPTSRRRRRASPLRQPATISYRSGPSTYTGYVGFVRQTEAQHDAERHGPPRRRNPSVWSSTQSVAATIAASGRSSWKFSSEYTTKGAVPKKKAARRPDRASQSARPAPKVAARPTARKPA
jgi:hypothetical protein